MLHSPLLVAEIPDLTMSRGAYIYASRPPRPSSTVSSASSTSSTSTRVCIAPLDFPSIQKLICTVFRSEKVAVSQAERLQSRIHQVFLTKLTDGSSLVLKCPPPTNLRLLRHEKNTFESEAKALDLLQDYTQIPVPRIVRYNKHDEQFGSPLLLLNHLPGRRLSELSTHLTAVEHSAIDRTLGSYVRDITSLPAPQFGMGHRVFDNRGSTSWREAFLAILEAALRDAEDILITIPYDSVRFYITKHSHVLDEVTEPRLTALNVCTPDNVLIDETTKRVTGLVGLSHIIWGDPLMSGGIAQGSESFFEGFGECPVRTGSTKIRMLMYAVYRSILTITTQHYRPHTNIAELEVRRELVCALNELARIERYDLQLRHATLELYKEHATVTPILAETSPDAEVVKHHYHFPSVETTIR